LKRGKQLALAKKIIIFLAKAEDLFSIYLQLKLEAIDWQRAKIEMRKIDWALFKTNSY
jgi:hypothetical protein